MIERLETAEELTSDFLTELAERHDISRAVIEYNGMWMLEKLYQNLPNEWRVRQEMLFLESDTFFSYNRNLRQLMYDKLSSCTVAVFQAPGTDFNRDMARRIVRGASRRTDIVYRFRNGYNEFDTEKEALPFDLCAPVVEISDSDFAIWARDITEDPEKYDGKVIRLKGSVVLVPELAEGQIGFGRYVMVCCQEDIQFVGFVCSGPVGFDLKNEEWLDITARIQLREHPFYEKTGPVLSLLAAKQCAPPSQPLATFY